MLRLLPQASRLGSAALAFDVVVSGLLPVVIMLATGALIATVGGEPSPLPGIRNPWQALALLVGSLAALDIVLPFLGPVAKRLTVRLDLLLRDRLLSGLLAPATLAHLEDPELADEVRLAHAVGPQPVRTSQAVVALETIVSNRLLALGSAVVLAGYRWWAPLLIALGWISSNGWYRREMAGLVASLEQSSTGFRRAQYLSDLALDGTAAKEIRIFGLARWLANRFEGHWREGMRQAWHKRRGNTWGMLRSFGVLIATHALVLGALVRSALRGEVGLGAVAVQAQAVLGLAGFAWDSDNEYALQLGTAPLQHAVRVEEATQPPRFQLPGDKPAPTRLVGGIRFHDASFTYPGTNQPVLRRVDLWVRPGRSLAIVGDNGSGKTTLLKLLCRFYDPTEGHLSVDDMDLREIDAASWQRRIAAVFQDFGRYPLSLRDNVAFGDLARRDDDEALERVLAAAGAADLPGLFPAGWETPLSRKFPNGTDPSGGQWQRVALARVLLAVEAGASLLVLDEPTASLDVRAEADFYERFLQLTRGLTTIIVSHRFSTVRHADHIVVVDKGRIVEFGTHDYLVALGGRYASAFKLQAEQYRRLSHV
ncbi:MAG: ABC transporter ATP-binding protein/permease [Actinomycetota bacterium]|nr:ABC transporter ATP-binding protein/permease [Actinomycetota bacterium]